MAIQTGEGPISITPSDLQFTHRGKKVAIKIRKLSWPVLIACLDEGSGWKADTILEDWADDPNPVLRTVNGDTMKWVRETLIPKINAWLLKVFPPIVSGGTTPTTTAPKTDDEALAQIDAALGTLKFVAAADGTVKVTL